MITTHRAFLDASVLYPVSLRNLLMRLALERLYQPQWSAMVHDEWIRSVLRDKPHIPPARLNMLRTAMDARIDDAVITEYEYLIETLVLPDPNDRHVLAAAIVGKSNAIITRNLRDFPDDILNHYQIQAIHPDLFVQQLINAAPSTVMQVVREQQSCLTNPPMPMDDLLNTFNKLDLTESVAALRRLIYRPTH